MAADRMTRTMISPHVHRETPQAFDTSALIHLLADGNFDAAYALVNLAALPNMDRDFRAIVGTQPWESLFQDTRQQSGIAAGPALVELPRRPYAREQMVGALLRADATCPCVIWLRSPFDISGLRRQLTLRLSGRFPDDFDVLIHFFDPRIAPLLCEVLAPKVLDAYFAPASAWHWRDARTGELHTLRHSGPADMPLDLPVTFTEAQQNALIEPTLVDRLVAAFEERFGIQYAEHPYAHWHQRATETYTRVKALELVSEPDILRLSLYAMLHEPGWWESPAIQSRLRRLIGGESTVEQVIAAFGGAA